MLRFSFLLLACICSFAHAQITVRVKVDTLCRFFIDGKLQGVLSPTLLHPYTLSAGKHTLRVEDDNLLVSATQYIDFSNGKKTDVINFNLLPPLRARKGNGLAIAPPQLLQQWKVAKILSATDNGWQADEPLSDLLSAYAYNFNENGENVTVDMGTGTPIIQTFLFEDDGEHLSFFIDESATPVQRFSICDLTANQLVLQSGSVRWVLTANN